MSLEDDLKARAVQLVSQQMATWVVAIQRNIAERQASLVKSLDDLGEMVARYDEQLNEEQIAAAFGEVLQGQALAPGGGGGADFDRLKAGLADIDGGASLSEVLTRLVNQASGFVSRAGIFIVKGANAIGWYGRGFAADDAIKQCNIPLNADTVFRLVANTRSATRGHLSHSPGTAQAMARLGGGGQGILAVPLILRDKVAAVLYCDTQAQELPAGDADAVEVLVQFAGKTIDLISFAPKAAGAGTPAAAPPPAPAPAPVPAPAPAPPPAPPPLAAPPLAPPPAAPGADQGSSTVMFDANTFAAMKQEAVASAPPTPAAPAVSPEQQKAHDDAKRFARLVVSEIKLYNEAKVNDGRRNKDIYERLKEDIERGRQMYSDRVVPAVRDATNYFYDELVRILAGGDASALGPM